MRARERWCAVVQTRCRQRVATVTAAWGSRAGQGGSSGSSDTQHWLPQSTLYLTRPGDTLKSVAEMHGVSVRSRSRVFHLSLSPVAPPRACKENLPARGGFAAAKVAALAKDNRAQGLIDNEKPSTSLPEGSSLVVNVPGTPRRQLVVFLPHLRRQLNCLSTRIEAVRGNDHDAV